MTRARGQPQVRIGVDTGGTFTDLVRLENGECTTTKVHSTPDDPSLAVLEAVTRAGGAPTGCEVVHGSTVGLNALLMGRGARTALVTNAGFRDLIEIGRQDRPEIYALHPRKREPLVPRELRFEVNQRSWPDPGAGQAGLAEVVAPSAEDLERLRQAIQASNAESIAVCLLHSYADPEIEQRIARELEPLGLPISCSAQILPSYREIERFSTAMVNASVSPIMRSYLARLNERLDGASLSIMQSSGGTLSAAAAAAEPVRVLLSGPAGGVVGAARAAAEAGYESIVTFDMGGTSTDVAFHSPQAGMLNAVAETQLGGHPVGVPSLDIHTIGCGGGSLARVDAGGILRVGPESAGADPGPACYGRGEEPTVTDAHVLLGHISSGSGGFLGGELILDIERVQRAFEKLGNALGVRPDAAARAVLDVARAAMRRAVSVMTMQRGHDPAGLPLVAFGGAGGLSAAALARSLGMPCALVPSRPGVLSAYGMATADAVRDHTASVLAPLGAWGPKKRKQRLAELAELGRQELQAAGFALSRVRHEYSLALRYGGQSFELPLAEGARALERFHLRHAELYGWALEDREVELVQLSARALVTSPQRVGVRPRRRPLSKSASSVRRSVDFDGVRVEALVIDRQNLRPGHAFSGPAIIEEFSGTTLVPPDCKALVTAGGHLSLH